MLDSVTFWIEEFQIDGLRLDVAYSLSDDFLILLRNHCNSLKEEFFLIGEMIHGDYNRLVQFNKLDSATNYECYKGLYSSFNSYNLFEIMHSLNRQFGPEEWTLYKGKHLLNFVDNHDVSRIATILENKKNWKALYALLFAMPGIPCIYYGSEWGIEGRKEDGDAALRPTLGVPADNQWIVFIRTLIRAYKKEKCFAYGDFKTIMLTNRQCGFMRQLEDRIGLFLINIDDQPYYCKVPGNFKDAIELLEDKKWDLSGQICLAPNTAYCFSLIENN